MHLDTQPSKYSAKAAIPATLVWNAMYMNAASRQADGHAHEHEPAAINWNLCVF